MKNFPRLACLALGLVSFVGISTNLYAAEPVEAPVKKKRAPLKQGDVAPDFTVIGPSGEEVSLADFRGQVVVLDFWATWCRPCLKAMPYYSEAAKTHAEDGLVVLSICVADTRENYDQWVKDSGADFAFQTAHDPLGKQLRESIFSKEYWVSMLPSVFVVDREGKIAGRVKGSGADSNLNELLDLAGLNKAASVAEAAPDAPAVVDAALVKPVVEKPVPAFRESLGRSKAGQPLPSVTVETSDGEAVVLSELISEGPMVLTVFKVNGLDEDGLEILNTWAARYEEQGLSMLGLVAYNSREEFDGWMSEMGDDVKFPVVFDPAGTSPQPSKPKDEMSDEEVDAYKAVRQEYFSRVVPMTLAGGPMAPVPHTIVTDRENKLLGAFMGLGEKTKESLGNLLLRAGISLDDTDRPAYVFSASETAPKPREKTVATLKAGQAAPDFTTIDIDGNEVKISDYRGKVIVLDFWATWCGPCMKAMPHLQQVATDYKDQGVVVLGSGTRDTRAAFEKWMGINGEKYPDIVWSMDPAERGSERASRALYGVAGIPTQFIIGRDGVIVEVTVGYLPGEVLVDAALAKAGIEVSEETLAKAVEDARKRRRM